MGGEDAGLRTRVFDAIREGDVAAVRALLGKDPGLAGARDERGLSAVRFARYRGRADLADVLLEAGPELDVFDAAAVGDVARLTQLIDADPSLPGTYSEDGFTPLHLAVFFGHAEAAHALVDRGAEVNPLSRNEMRVMPLHSAVAGNDIASARVLVEHGADVNASSHEGWTPLHGAAQHGNPELVEILLAAGADPATRMDAGQTPADTAMASGQEGIAERLRAAAASPA
jgi:ankyrin repeat protein